MEEIMQRIFELSIDQQADVFTQLKNKLRSTVEKQTSEFEKRLEELKKIKETLNN